MRTISYFDVPTVGVIYFALGQGEDYVYHGSTTFRGIHKNDILQLTEKQKQIFSKPSLSEVFPNHWVIKTNDFDDNARDSLDEWIYFLKNSEIKDEFKAKGLAEAREKLKEINLSPEDLRRYRRYLEQLHYEASIAETIKFDKEFDERKAREKGWEKGMEKGRKEGRKEGVEQEKIKTAIVMKKEGESIDKISKYTGLSIEKIEEL